jgi:hypothetical protein
MALMRKDETTKNRGVLGGGKTRIQKTGNTRLRQGLPAFGGAIGDQGYGAARETVVSRRLRTGIFKDCNKIYWNCGTRWQKLRP